MSCVWAWLCVLSGSQSVRPPAHCHWNVMSLRFTTFHVVWWHICSVFFFSSSFSSSFLCPQAELLTIQTELLMGCFFRRLILLPGLKIYSLKKLKKTAQRRAGTLACCLVGWLAACLRLSPIFLVADVDEGILIFLWLLLLLFVSFAPYLFPSRRKCWQQQVLCEVEYFRDFNVPLIYKCFCVCVCVFDGLP